MRRAGETAREGLEDSLRDRGAWSRGYCLLPMRAVIQRKVVCNRRHHDRDPEYGRILQSKQFG
jgi:hypothetical protein